MVVGGVGIPRTTGLVCPDFLIVDSRVVVQCTAFFHVHRAVSNTATNPHVPPVCLSKYICIEQSHPYIS